MSSLVKGPGLRQAYQVPPHCAVAATDVHTQWSSDQAQSLQGLLCVPPRFPLLGVSSEQRKGHEFGVRKRGWNLAVGGGVYLVHVSPVVSAGNVWRGVP